MRREGLSKAVQEPWLWVGDAGLSEMSSRHRRQLRAGGRAHASLVAPFDAWIRSSLGPANSNTSSEISSNWWWATSGLWNENSKTFDWVQVKWIFIICSVNFCQDEWYYDSILIISEVDSLLFSSIWKEHTANTWKIYCSVREEFCSSFWIHPWHLTEWKGALCGSLIQHKSTDLGIKRGIRFFFLTCHAAYFYIFCISVFFWQTVVIFDRTWIFSFQRVLPVDKLACLTERMVSLCHLYHKANNNVFSLIHSQLRL